MNVGLSNMYVPVIILLNGWLPCAGSFFANAAVHSFTHQSLCYTVMGKDMGTRGGCRSCAGQECRGCYWELEEYILSLWVNSLCLVVNVST